MAVYFFWGQEEYLMEKEIKKLKDGLLDASFMSMAYKVFDNPPFNDFIQCLQSAPLMFGKTLTLINMNKYLLSGDKSMSFDDKQIASIESALTEINENVNIIVVCKVSRDENKKPDSRKKLYKVLSKYSQMREFAQIPIYKDELTSMIMKISNEKGITLTKQTAEFLKEQLGSNLTLIDSELEKLQVAVYPRKTIEAEDIKKYCTLTEDVFLLADLIIEGNKNEILRQYSILTEKKHPLEIFGALQSSFQKFIFIKNYEKKMSKKEIAYSLKLNEFVIDINQKKLKNVTLERLIQIRKNLINSEYKLKTGQIADGGTVLELALLS